MPAENTPATVKMRICGSGGASGLAIGTSSVTASPSAAPSCSASASPEYEPVAARLERSELARQQEWPDPRDGILALRVDAAQRHRHHFAAVQGQRLQFHVGRDAHHSRKRCQARGQHRVVHVAGRARIDHPRVRRQREQPIAQLVLESVHDREHDDQRRDAQRHSPERHPGDEGHEERMLAGAHVAQAHEHRQRLEHAPRI